LIYRSNRTNLQRLSGISRPMSASLRLGLLNVANPRVLWGDIIPN
jgi:hypothetical protein